VLFVTILTQKLIIEHTKVPFVLLFKVSFLIAVADRRKK
jgi:hypothetical protein